MPPPDLFTITEAAAVLRIGRTTAYQLARRDLATSGGEGLGVVRIGGQFRIPRAGLERITGGPIHWPTDRVPAPATTPALPVPINAAPPTPERGSSPTPDPAGPLTLPFGS